MTTLVFQPDQTPARTQVWRQQWQRKHAAMISPIVSGIFISGVESMKDQDAVRRQGIRAVLRLDGADRGAGQWGTEFTLLDMPIADGKPLSAALLKQATAFINEQVKAQRPILVHCQMGVSRATSIVIAYLVEYLGMALPKAYALVAGQRPYAQPHPALIGSIVEAYALPYDFTDIYSTNFLRRLLQEYQQ